MFILMFFIIPDAGKEYFRSIQIHMIETIDALHIVDC